MIMNFKKSEKPWLLTAVASWVARLALLMAVAFAANLSLTAQDKEHISKQTLNPLILQAEDLLRITFPAAPELDTQLQVRRDGIISVPIIGEVVAAGKSPSELEAYLAEQFEDQLVSNEVMVVVLESNFTYYLEGEVRSPGIIKSFRQLSVLEAIIAAGGINKTTGKLNSVIVLRRTGDQYQRFDLDLKAVLDGKDGHAFILESYDVVSIPQRIW